MAPAPPNKRKAAAPAGGDPATATTTKQLKQGNLFSFFSKKPRNGDGATPPQNKSSPAARNNGGSAEPSAKTSPAAAAPPPPPASPSTKSVPSVPKASPQPPPSGLPHPVQLGDSIQVYWDDDEKWYTARVVRQRPCGFTYWLEYEEDGDGEWLDLSTHAYRPVPSTTKASRKRRQIQEEDDDDSDEEMEFDGSASIDDESEFVDDNDHKEQHSDDEDDQWIVSEDEEEDSPPQRKNRRLLKVTVESGSKGKKTPASVPRTSSSLCSPSVRTPKSVTPALSAFSAPPKSTPPLTQFSHATPSASSSTYSDRGKCVTASSSSSLDDGTASPVAAVSKPFRAPSTKDPTQTPSPPMFVLDAINPAGSHVHNHLAFLRNPRDAQGRPRTHPDYDPRTLRVDAAELERLCGRKMTNAVVQWWDLKSQYFDTVLLFKTGKFYELFHMDADVGVQVCDLSYMKGHVAHSGFPEISYGSMAEKLVLAGYKVARVEQTETPEQLQVRKKKTTKGIKPQVVNREVCSILTAGTRTCCYLEQPQQDIVAAGNTGSGNVGGPLLAIAELPLERDGGAIEENEDEVLPVCEYGVTLVDAVRGIVTVGQFADDVLRSRMNTLLTIYAPSEILLQGGDTGASPELRSLLRLIQNNRPSMRIETIRAKETFPKSTAVDPAIRKQLERGLVHPWDVPETLKELHRRRYFPQASKKRNECSVSRWPAVLKAAVDGEANLLLSSFGAALFYLQRNLVDAEILSLGYVKAYIPPSSSTAQEKVANEILSLARQEQERLTGVEGDDNASTLSSSTNSADFSQIESTSSAHELTTHLSLDGTTLHNLEILNNSTDYTVSGSLWSIVNHTRTPHGSRLLRAWLLRPLFRKQDIDRRADAVQELVSGSAAVALAEAQSILSQCGDIERLLSRIHSMSGTFRSKGDDDNDGDDLAVIHPNERAVLYETATYTKRKVGDFSKLLNSLRVVSRLPEVFQGIDIQSGLLRKIVHLVDDGGCFPNLTEPLNWFFENFDCDCAAKGQFEPAKGIDDEYDAACEAVERIEADLRQYRDEMVNLLQPRSLAKSSWQYVNTKPDSKDKYLIELPIGVAVPDEFVVKGKRGKGPKQVNKYRTPVVEQLVQELERALDVQKERKARGMQLIFAAFDSMRSLWAAASTATALLDALGSLAKASTNQGYTRPVILECTPNSSSSIQVIQGRHPCVEKSLGPGDFVPNDLELGTKRPDGSMPRVLLLSGVNMGGKSTALRQTCLIAILAQIGCFVPAEVCKLTPVDRIYTRLGASDRILLGQSTFFVELAETAAALRGATPRSLVIMDELGRGTSTFDGTAIASATVQHLVERTKCLCLFATHYHTLLDEWQGHPHVKLGHMECVVENGKTTIRGAEATEDEGTITFLYTLGEGGCPRSFGINVARLARLPQEVVSSARQASADFERLLKSRASDPSPPIGDEEIHDDSEKRLVDALRKSDWDQLLGLFESVNAQ